MTADKDLDLQNFQSQILALLESRQIEELRAFVEGQAFAFEGLDLSNKNLDGLNLEGFDLRGAILPKMLRDVNFHGACLQGMEFNKVLINSVNFSNADLQGANFIESTLHDINFSGANLQDAEIKDCRMGKTNFRNADIRRAVIVSTTFNDTDFKGVNWGENTPEDRPVFKLVDVQVPPEESLGAEIKKNPFDETFQAYLDSEALIEAEADAIKHEIEEAGGELGSGSSDDMDIEGMNLGALQNFIKNLAESDEDTDLEGVNVIKEVLNGVEGLNNEKKANDKYGKN